MKATLYDISGTKKGDVELPAFFSEKVREDLVGKAVESERMNDQFLYSTFKEAGKRHSASGTISHRRHEWKGHYGKGISRVPRKAMYRRGTQFFWIGAEVSGTRGGRQAHPPHGIRRFRKINEKEYTQALHSALAATASEHYLKQRYATLSQTHKAPLVLDMPEKAKTKAFHETLSKLLGSAITIALKEKAVRAGKGKQRGRKYKENAGLLVVTSRTEKLPASQVDVKAVHELSLSDLYPLGRLTLFTKKALEELK
ncbi:MAG TPA: 50S ribosomal protein L4 [Candidatus Nanoarchaeia archaeon]|nr:50S ribosomal protein L4 [Candidatus Nanoarchaeia archaeon]